MPRMSLKGHEFRVCKIDPSLYQFFFKKRESVDYILGNGLWNVEDHLLILNPWTENITSGGLSFTKTEFWVQVSGLPSEWYSSYLKDCQMVELCSYWGSNDKFYCIQWPIQIDKPLRRFLRAGPSIRDECRGLMKYERLPSMCFRCGCLSHVRRDCKHIVQEPTRDRFWYDMQSVSMQGGHSGGDVHVAQDLNSQNGIFHIYLLKER